MEDPSLRVNNSYFIHYKDNKNYLLCNIIILVIVKLQASFSFKKSYYRLLLRIILYCEASVRAISRSPPGFGATPSSIRALQIGQSPLILSHFFKHSSWK